MACTTDHLFIQTCESRLQGDYSDSFTSCNTQLLCKYYSNMHAVKGWPFITVGVAVLCILFSWNPKLLHNITHIMYYLSQHIKTNKMRTI